MHVSLHAYTQCVCNSFFFNRIGCDTVWITHGNLVVMAAVTDVHGFSIRLCFAFSIVSIAMCNFCNVEPQRMVLIHLVKFNKTLVVHHASKR